MKTTLLSISMFAVAVASSNASVTISGTALNGGFISVGDKAILIADTSGTGFDSGALFDTALGGSMSAGLDIFSGATYGTGIEVLGSTTVALDFLSSPFAGFSTVFDLGTVADGDEFAVVVFDASTTTSIDSDTYKLYTSSSNWLVPSDGGTNTLTTLTTGSTFGGTVVVPEPSTYAALAGFCALGYVMVRRRRV